MLVTQLKLDHLAEPGSFQRDSHGFYYALGQQYEDVHHNDRENAALAINSLIEAIVTKDSFLFDYVEETYRGKKMEADNTWIYNNYLLLLLLIGAETFKRDKTWLKTAMPFRRTIGVEDKIILEFFNAALYNSDLKGRKTMPPLLVYTYLAKPEDVNAMMLNEIPVAPELFATCHRFKSRFLKMLYLYAFDILSEYSDKNYIERYPKADRFKPVLKVSVLTSFIIYVILLLLIGIGYLLLRMYH